MAINSDTDIHLAIHQLGLNECSYSLNQSVPPHTIIKWDSNNSNSQPTDDELNSAYTTWKTANDYKRKREDSYLSIQDQLDMQYWDSVNGTTIWKDHVAAVKAKYSKPS